MSALKSLFWVVLAFGLILAGFFMPGSQTVALNVLLEQIRGEYWYRLELSQQNIGQYHASTTQNSQKNTVFASSLHFTLPGASSTQINESLVFSASPPYPLLSGSYIEISAGQVFRELTLTQVKPKIEQDNPVYALEIKGDGKTRTRKQSFIYTLHDHLDLEMWLKHQQPSAGNILHTRHFDFDKFKPEAITWKIVEHTHSGYVVSNSSILDDSVYTLDKNLLPYSFSLAGLFKLYRVNAGEARLATRNTMLRTESLYVPVRKALGDPKIISDLRMEINTISSKVLKNSSSHRIHTQNNIHLLETRVQQQKAADSDQSLADALSETLLYPTQHPHIIQLAKQLALGLVPEADKPRALVEFVNAYLVYEEHTQPLTLIDALLSRSGDCTEYADLLTTLARFYGIPAKTITGLAYSDSPTPGFYVHAWNHLLVNGKWLALDPTWNETQVDATHIAFPSDTIGQLKAYAAIPAMHFEIKNVTRTSIQ